MNRILTAAALTLAAACSLAHADDTAAVASLKSECAAKHVVKTEAAAENEYQFVYSKGEYRGEAQAGKALPCSEHQYVAYLETVDPVRVMNAYPTAAGRPTLKDAKDRKDDSKK
ncbi:MAG: hypothetical protein JO224_03860 [Pelomonas sp.]|nr:hypothetical protein [Roseateles sp.]